jgi:hypothetical protein
VGNISPGALPNGQQGTQEIDGILIVVDRWAATLVNPADAPLVTPDAGLGLAPVNNSDVTNNPTAPQIEPGSTPYVQPHVAAPSANAEVSVAGVAPPPSAIKVVEGVNYIQANPAPAPSAQVEASTAGGKYLNPMQL